MSHNVTTHRGLVTFSTHAGPHAQAMAQITLVGAFGSIPVRELDRMCAEWTAYRATQSPGGHATTDMVRY